MFEYLFELLFQFWERIVPFVVIDQYNAGVVMRMGSYNRETKTGLNWKIPFIEEVLTATTVVTTHSMRPQTLTTADGMGIVVASIVKYEIRNVRPYLLEIWDRTDVLTDVTLSAIRQAVGANSLEDILNGEIEDQVLRSVRSEVNKYGFKVHRVTFADLGKVRSLRLISDNLADYYSEEEGS